MAALASLSVWDLNLVKGEASVPQLEANGEVIAYEVSGRGPALVLLHSLGSSSHAWAGELKGLSDRFRVIAPDCRGHGHSTDRTGITLDATVDDLVALLDHLQVAQAHIAGLSMGGVQAIRFYERYPQRVRSLVLADTFATFGRERADARLRDTAAKLDRVSMKDFGHEYAYGTLRPETPEAPKRALAEVISEMQPGSYLEAARACFMADLEHVLPLIQVPALVLVGDRDNRTPPEWSRAMAAAIPGAQYAEIPGAGHLSNLDQPEAFIDVLVTFLDQVP